MNSPTSHVTTSCGCGGAQLRLSAAPGARFRCHCTICQGVYNAPFADVLVFRRGQARAIDPGALRWVRTRTASPLRRGLCRACGDPVMGQLFGAVTLVPARSATGLSLPDPACDIYYDTRVTEVDDAAPKSAGLVGAYLGLALPILGTLARPARRVGSAASGR